jgi:hypothetical protein
LVKIHKTNILFLCIYTNSRKYTPNWHKPIDKYAEQVYTIITARARAQKKRKRRKFKMNNTERINELHAKIRQELTNKEALIDSREYLEFKDADTTEVEAELAETRANIKAMREELRALLDAESAEEKEKELQAKIKQKFEAKQPLLREQARLCLNSKDTAEVDGKIAEIESSVNEMHSELNALRCAEFAIECAEKSEADDEEEKDLGKRIKNLQLRLRIAYSQRDRYVFHGSTSKAEIEADLTKGEEEIAMIKAKLKSLGAEPEEWNALDIFDIPSSDFGAVAEEEVKIYIDFDVFAQQYNAAKSCDNSDKFIIRPWEDWMNPAATRASVVDLLSYIYNVSKNGFNEIAKQYKSLRELSDKFNIPYSTVQKWGAGKATPPEYLLTMMAYVTIIG